MVQLSEWRWNQVNAVRHCSPLLSLCCPVSWVEVIHGEGKLWPSNIPLCCIWFSNYNETLLCCSTWRQSQSFTFIEAEGLILYYWLIEFLEYEEIKLARQPILWNKFWNSCIGECFIYSRKLENINLFSLLMLTIPGKRFLKRGVFNFNQQYYDKVRLNWPHKVNPGQSTGCS